MMKQVGPQEHDALPTREPRRVLWIWGVYLVLYAVAIPWYWPQGYRGPLLGGFPLWAAVSLGCAVLLALFTAWVIFRYWEED
jgi:hypothetical protein